MAVDFGLNGVGARERGLFGHQRCCSTQGKARDVPQRLKRGWPHAPLGHQLIEAGEVPLLLRRHACDQLGFRAVTAKHRQLTGVDLKEAKDYVDRL